MTVSLVRTETQGAVATVWLNQPERRNALSRQLVENLIDTLKSLDADESVHAIVLTGSGTAFCAGADLDEFSRLGTQIPAELYQDAYRAADLFRLGSELKTPLIGAVNGPALGGGLGLVAMCHLVVASENARLGTTELRVGLIPFVILPLIRRAVGEKQALKLMLLAEPITAQEACRIGLVQSIVPPEKVLEEASGWASTVASFSPLAVKMGLDAFFTTQDWEADASFRYLARLRVLSFLSEDLKEGAEAFLEKRKPVWRGR